MAEESEIQTGKLVVMIMGQNCEDTIDMCLESVKDADAIVYCDGGSTDSTDLQVDEFMIQSKKEVKLISNKYDKKDKTMNGKQRNFYLNYLKENYMNWYCLCLDADEVLEDQGIEKLRFLIQNGLLNTKSQNPLLRQFLLSPKIHHFVGDLGHEDNTRPEHFVPNRFFNITERLIYPEVEHPVLSYQVESTPNEVQIGTIQIEIWHFREAFGVFSYLKKHNNNWKKSNIHQKDYLRWWRDSMLMGTYPRKSIYFGQLPQVIKNKFKLFQE